MKFIIDGADKEMGHITVETKDVPEGFMYQTQPIYQDRMLAGFVITFCLADTAEDTKI